MRRYVQPPVDTNNAEVKGRLESPDGHTQRWQRTLKKQRALVAEMFEEWVQMFYGMGAEEQ